MVPLGTCRKTVNGSTLISVSNTGLDENRKKPEEAFINSDRIQEQPVHHQTTAPTHHSVQGYTKHIQAVSTRHTRKGLIKSVTRETRKKIGREARLSKVQSTFPETPGTKTYLP